VGIVEESKIVRPKTVAIPMLQEHLERGESEEAIHVKDLLQAGEAPGGVRFTSRGKKRGKIGAVIGFLAGIHFELLGNVAAGTAVVKIALGGFEVAFEKAFVVTLHEHVET